MRCGLLRYGLLCHAGRHTWRRNAHARPVRRRVAAQWRRARRGLPLGRSGWEHDVPCAPLQDDLEASACCGSHASCTAPTASTDALQQPHEGARSSAWTRSASRRWPWSHGGVVFP